MMVKTGAKVTADNLCKLLLSLQVLAAKQVLVGIPAENDVRTGDEKGPMNNATLAYIHEHGAPEAGIPARPFLVPGIKQTQPKVLSILKATAKRAVGIKADPTAAENGLKAAGMVAVSAVQAYINDAPFTPLAESTIKARARRGRKGAKAELTRRADGGGVATAEDIALSNANVRPLVDTGQMRRAITYVLRGRGKHA